MRPAGKDRRSPLEVKDEPSEVMVTSDGPAVRGYNRVVLLSAEAEEGLQR